MKFILLRTAGSWVIFLVAMMFERSVQERTLILIGLMLTFTLMPMIRGKSHKRLSWTLVIDVVLVVALNAYSRFNINYLFVLLQFWVVVESVVWQTRNIALGLSIISFIGLIYGFSQTWSYGFNYQMGSQMVSIAAMFLLFMILLFLYRSYVDEKARVDRLNDTLKSQNEEFALINQNLLESSRALALANQEVSKLSRLKERSQMAKVLHDTLGHELTGHIMSLEMIKMSLSKTDPEMVLNVQNAIDHSREMLRAMRSLVSEHKDIIKHESLYDALSKKIMQFQNQTEIITTFSYELFDEALDDERYEVLYRTVMESLTNSARHGKANKVWISLQCLEEKAILLKVDDNGGTSSYIKGNGLKFIEDRVTLLDGQVTFECDENGFRTKVILPLSHAS